MKKSLLILGMLAIGFANAQQEFDGKVGVNTNQPSATLKVKSKTGNDGTTRNLELVNANEKNLLKVFDNGNAILGHSGVFSFFETFDGGATGHFGARSYWAESNNEEGPYLHMENRTKTDNGSIWRMFNFGKATGQGLAFTQYNNQLKNGKTVLMLKDDGNVGIGSNFPQEKLHVGGGIRTELGLASGIGGYIEIVNTPKSGAGNEKKAANWRIYNMTGPTYADGLHFFGYPESKATRPITELASLLVLADTGNVGISASVPTHKLHIKADPTKDPLKLEGLQETSDASAKNLVVVDGVVKIGAVASTGATQLSGTDNITCNDANRGKMNFKRDVTLASGGTADAIGVCLKGSDGKYYWHYMYGSSGKGNGTGTFGSGLQ